MDYINIPHVDINLSDEHPNKEKQIQCEDWITEHPDAETRSIMVKSLLRGNSLTFQGGSAGERYCGERQGEGGCINFKPGNSNTDEDPGADVRFYDRQGDYVTAEELVSLVKKFRED